ncbi:MAG TPA: SPOR domain-containing protein [Thioploca sp.]|nr:MAG: hypothetical protein DRR19_05830 [Gammaproteobacteria bacterium]HDN27156.1 SPOR domain-containing protein [Thioploca sp.]
MEVFARINFYSEHNFRQKFSEAKFLPETQFFMGGHFYLRFANIEGPLFFRDYFDKLFIQSWLQFLLFKNFGDDMALQNIRNNRRTVTDSYDPKQRIVGGVVLFLLMLFIYSVLKLVLGFSVPEKFEIDSALNFENFNRDGGSLIDAAQTSQLVPRQLPEGFVFLDLKGNPMQPEPPSVDFNLGNDPFAPDGEDKWYVQAASFKTEERAQRLVQKIKTKHIAKEVHVIPSGSWYAVRLPPQSDRNRVQQQYRQLHSLLRLQGQIKKIKLN